jgi:membrane protease YdiL (CAAX protease family)
MFRESHKSTGDDLAKTASGYVIEVTMYIVVSICEEIQFRGYVLEALSDITGSSVTAVILQAVAFALMHGTGQGLADYAIRFAFGLGFGFITIHRKSILPAVAAHLTINIAAFISGLL